MKSGQESSLGRMRLLHRSLHGSMVLLIMTMASMSFSLIMLATVFYQSENARMIPYIVTLDRHGVVMGHGPVSPAPEIPETAIAAALSGFISELLLITADRELQTASIYSVYAHLLPGSQLEAQIKHFYESGNPFDLAGRGTRSVQLENVIRQSERTWMIDFTEVSRSELATRTRRKRALVSYELGAVPDSPKVLLRNPLGIYITALETSEVMNHETG